MTQWEEQRMAGAVKNAPRFYALDVSSPDGYSEYGIMLYDYDMYETVTEDNGRINVSLLRCNNEEQDGITPLACGSFFRVSNYGDVDENNKTIFEYESDGQPKNFRNYYITSGKSRWFELPFDGRPERYKHTYEAAEIIECLKDYPIRSTKTFAEGVYTFKKCLEIAFELAFRPRSLGSYRIVIKDNKALDVPNSKLEYTNATLLDVVYEIGRIIDMVPSMELNYINGVYEFELYFTDRYGLEGNITDISFFQAGTSDNMNYDRDNSAGSSISNVENLLAESRYYPAENRGLFPADTNSQKDWFSMTVPYPINELDEIAIWWQHEILKGDLGWKIELWDKTEFTPKGQATVVHVEQGFTSEPMVLKRGIETPIQIYNTARSQVSPDSWEKINIYLLEYEEYYYLAESRPLNAPSKSNTIWYKRGENILHLDALKNKYIYWFKFLLPETEWRSFQFVESPNGTADMYGKNTFALGLKYSPMLNGVIKGINSKPTDITAFFNQQAQVVDIQSFGTSVNNYTKSMNGENRIVVRTFENRDFIREHFAAIPKLGSSVIDTRRKKRYVITDYSLTRKPNSLELICTLNESRAGKSRSLMADNSQTIYAIPNNNVVDSKSHTHIVCKLGRWTFGHTPSAAVEKPYVFNAFLGNVHFGDKRPNTTRLTIHTSEGDKELDVPIFNSRIRLAVFMQFRMLNNSYYDIKEGLPIRYTDGKGLLESIDFRYLSDAQNVAAFSQTIRKDSYEILNHTTQVSWVEYGNIRIHENFIDMSFFGAGDGINEPLRLVLLSSRMNLNDSIAEHTAASYDVTVYDNGESFAFTAIGMPEPPPQHLGWALARGNRVLVLDNFHILTDNVCKVYYDIEVQD